MYNLSVFLLLTITSCYLTAYGICEVNKVPEIKKSKLNKPNGNCKKIALTHGLD